MEKKHQSVYWYYGKKKEQKYVYCIEHPICIPTIGPLRHEPCLLQSDTNIPELLYILPMVSYYINNNKIRMW